MSIATQISRIKGLRNRIKSRLITLGVLSNTNADLSACTTAIESIQGINQQWHMSTVSAIADTYGGDWYLKIPIPTIHITNIKMICLECSPNYSSDNKFIIYIDINHYITASSTTILGRKSQGNAIIDTVNFFMASPTGGVSSTIRRMSA